MINFQSGREVQNDRFLTRKGCTRRRKLKRCSKCTFMRFAFRYQNATGTPPMQLPPPPPVHRKQGIRRETPQAAAKISEVFPMHTCFKLGNFTAGMPRIAQVFPMHRCFLLDNFFTKLRFLSKLRKCSLCTCFLCTGGVGTWVLLRQTPGSYCDAHKGLTASVAVRP